MSADRIRSGGPYVSVVLKRSSWRKWVEEEADARIAELLEKGDETVQRMRQSHADHVQTIEEVRQALVELGAAATWHDRPHAFRIEGGCDLVVVVGGDGTLLGASHGVGPGVPLLGVNSSPSYSVGFFCGAKKGNAKAAIAAALAGTLKRTELARMRVELNGCGLLDRVLNEALFCHISPAATSRYILRLIGADGVLLAEEEQKSSGIWVGPAAGSTAAQRSAGGRILPMASNKLQYVVREPYRPHGEMLSVTLGVVGEDQALTIKSKMRKACLFVDGDPLAHEVAIGDVVTMRRSNEPLVVLGLSRSHDTRRR
jgi:NAD+ kinase